MFVNESINICEATPSTISLLELGKIEGIVTGIGLAIIASIGLAIKALFVWYIQYRAPKDRPINTLIWYDQVNTYHLLYYIQICKLFLNWDITILAIPIYFGATLFNHDYSTDSDSNTIVGLHRK